MQLTQLSLAYDRPRARPDGTTALWRQSRNHPYRVYDKRHGRCEGVPTREMHATTLVREPTNYKYERTCG